MRTYRIHILISLLLLPILVSMAQSPTHIDQGTNDPSVNVWDDPKYILLIGGIVLLGFIFLFTSKWISKKRRRD